MDKAQTKRNMKHWGIVSTRLAGTDGVSLEAAKWANVFEEEGLSCFYFAGELDRPQERSYLAPEAHFTHPKVQEIQRVSFGVIRRDRSLSQKIHELSHILKDHLYAFIEKFDIGLLLVENAFLSPGHDRGADPSAQIKTGHAWRGDHLDGYRHCRPRI